MPTQSLVQPLPAPLAMVVRHSDTRLGAFQLGVGGEGGWRASTSRTIWMLPAPVRSMRTERLAVREAQSRRPRDIEPSLSGHRISAVDADTCRFVVIDRPVYITIPPVREKSI